MKRRVETAKISIFSEFLKIYIKINQGYPIIYFYKAIYISFNSDYTQIPLTGVFRTFLYGGEG